MRPNRHKKIHKDWEYGTYGTTSQTLNPQKFRTHHEGGNDKLPLSYQLETIFPLDNDRPKVLYGEVEIRGFTCYEEIGYVLEEIIVELWKSVDIDVYTGRSTEKETCE